VRERKKAGDLFRESTPVFGRKTTFAEAYPEIEDIVIEVEETGDSVDSENRHRRYTTKYLPGEFINCSNPMCYGGGFHLGSYLHSMVSEQKTELEESTLCRGNEGSPKGRRIYRKCLNLFKVKINITYKVTQG
jgi:hypothetical protein